MIFAIIILVVITVLIGASWHFSNLIIYPAHFSREGLFAIEIEAGRLSTDRYDGWSRQTVSIQSPYGYTLHGLFFPVDGSRKTVIICHGITANIAMSVKYMDLYRDRGFNILIYDHRNHGESGGKNTTFGFYEKYDLKAWIDWVQQTCGKNSIIAAHGESMGAGIILQCLGIDDRISFAVSDCGFCDLTQLLTFRLKADYHLPPFPLLPITNWITRLRTGMYFSAVSPIRAIQNVSTPILFVHGLLDTYVPTYMSEKMYEQKPETRRLYLTLNAGHVESYWRNPKEYDRQFSLFLAELVQERETVKDKG